MCVSVCVCVCVCVCVGVGDAMNELFKIYRIFEFCIPIHLASSIFIYSYFFLISRLNVDKAGVELMEEEIYWVKQSLSPRTLPGVL